jgi:hypothetical protein
MSTQKYWGYLANVLKQPPLKCFKEKLRTQLKQMQKWKASRKKIEDIRKNQMENSEVKNTISELKIPMDRLNGRTEKRGIKAVN